MFFAALFWVYGDYKPPNRKSNSKQKTSPQSYKTQINILPFPGLAQTGTEQLGQGATRLGWPKSIYYCTWFSFMYQWKNNAYIWLQVLCDNSENHAVKILSVVWLENFTKYFDFNWVCF